jgi:hypothetical protein
MLFLLKVSFTVADDARIAFETEFQKSRATTVSRFEIFSVLRKCNKKSTAKAIQAYALF